ncbi:2'-5'-RNA ligase [Symmachiella dynata]|uniref:RNA 2',3'-cyclic phosphodiesterase n=1 Tax=Symmachiella dynata TaxID=2527995 RepID=UPI00118CF560|nr:RNA 2',3'-cyclic phosphodiesterase [Symmachiella dynata]QDT50351.1 2'-5'-RNA ligase [Symmachiella dynata]
MLRTFLAFRIAANPKLQRVHADLGELGRSVRPVVPENWHVTLKFLGDTQESMIAPLTAILEEAAAGREPFLVDLHGLGVFPHLRRPNVVWVGLRTDAGLGELVETFNERLAPLGFPRETRPFAPHLTVARIKRTAPVELATYVANNANTDYGSHIVESLELYQSELTSQGARYTVMATAELR